MLELIAHLQQAFHTCAAQTTLKNKTKIREEKKGPTTVLPTERSNRTAQFYILVFSNMAFIERRDLEELPLLPADDTAAAPCRVLKNTELPEAAVPNPLPCLLGGFN